MTKIICEKKSGPTEWCNAICTIHRAHIKATNQSQPGERLVRKSLLVHTLRKDHPKRRQTPEEMPDKEDFVVPEIQQKKRRVGHISTQHAITQFV